MAFFSSSGIDKSESHPDFSRQSTSTDDQTVHKKISELVTGNRVVLFMKGSPEAPQCGFSRTVVKLLAAEEIDDYVFAFIFRTAMNYGTFSAHTCGFK